MKTKHLKFAALALLPGALLILSACAPSIPGEQASAVSTSETSTTFIDTFQATARVSAIDAKKRTLTLTLENGKHTTVKCGPEVANFKQIRVDDVVKVSVTEEMSAYLDKSGRMGRTGEIAGELAPIGAKPGGTVSDTMQETMKITAINTKTRKVTFMRQNGISMTTKVGDHINLAKAKVGDRVTISHTQGTAVSVEKP